MVKIQKMRYKKRTVFIIYVDMKAFKGIKFIRDESKGEINIFISKDIKYRSLEHRAIKNKKTKRFKKDIGLGSIFYL